MGTFGVGGAEKLKSAIYCLRLKQYDAPKVLVSDLSRARALRHSLHRLDGEHALDPQGRVLRDPRPLEAGFASLRVARSRAREPSACAYFPPRHERARY